MHDSLISKTCLVVLAAHDIKMIHQVWMNECSIAGRIVNYSFSILTGITTTLFERLEPLSIMEVQSVAPVLEHHGNMVPRGLRRHQNYAGRYKSLRQPMVKNDSPGKLHRNLLNYNFFACDSIDVLGNRFVDPVPTTDMQTPSPQKWPSWHKKCAMS